MEMKGTGINASLLILPLQSSVFSQWPCFPSDFQLHDQLQQISHIYLLILRIRILLSLET